MNETRHQTLSNARFVRLWTTASRRVYAYILTLIPNKSDAEDLLQEVGITAWQKFAEYDATRDFVAWSCGIAHFKVLAYLRASSRHATLSEALLEELRQEMESMSELLDLQHTALQNCLDALPETDRLLISLRYQPKTTIEHIAATTGRTVAAAYKVLQRIHQRLFDCASRKLAAEGRL